MKFLFRFGMSVALAVALIRILMTKETPVARPSRHRAGDSLADAKPRVQEPLQESDLRVAQNSPL
jgi:hypothetical protein